MVIAPSRSSALQFVFGAWLALGLATWVIAAGSFVTAGHVSREPRVARELTKLGDGAGLLRHQAAETNRLAFTLSGRAQVALGGLAVLLAAWPPRASRLVLSLTVAAAALSSVLALLVVPAALSHAAKLALVPLPLPDDLLPVHRAMQTSHALYAGLDLTRAALVALAALLLLRQSRRLVPQAAALALLLVAPACTSGPPPAAPPPAARSAAPAAPAARTSAFDAGRAWRHLEAVVAMGPRLGGHPGHERFRSYARRHFESAGWTVTEQAFTYQVPGEERVYELANVSALLGPRDENTILLGTHFDTRPWSDQESDEGLRNRPVPGANDGGSGVAVLLEVARVLAENPPDHGVEIVLFDGEDLGRSGHPEEYSQGAQHLVRTWAETTGGAPLPAAVVVIDMVADTDLLFVREAASVKAAPALTESLWRAAGRLGYGEHFSEGRPRGIWDDHRPFLDAGVPAALLIDLDYEPWHTVRDTIDKCSPESLDLTGRVVLEALFGP